MDVIIVGNVLSRATTKHCLLLKNYSVIWPGRVRGQPDRMPQLFLHARQSNHFFSRFCAEAELIAVPNYFCHRTDTNNFERSAE